MMMMMMMMMMMVRRLLTLPAVDRETRQSSRKGHVCDDHAMHATTTVGHSLPGNRLPPSLFETRPSETPQQKKNKQSSLRGTMIR
jgi:hypothetical protein